MMGVKGSEEVINLGLISHERIFPILNKLDRIWNHHSEKSYSEINKILFGLWFGMSIKSTSFYPNDLEFTKLLDEYIDKYKIK